MKGNTSNKVFVFNWVIIVLSLFIMVFTLLNELLGLGAKSTVFLLTLIISSGVYFHPKKIDISSYILLPVIILDGFFHLTSPLENLIKNSPDWIIAFNLYGGNGMPVIVHQAMGVFLLITSGLFVYILTKKKKNWYYYFYKYIVTVITLSIISLSFVLKMYK